jgi:hypothetical protein
MHDPLVGATAAALAAEHGRLMPQYQQLGVLGELAAPTPDQ